VSGVREPLVRLGSQHHCVNVDCAAQRAGASSTSPAGVRWTSKVSARTRASVRRRNLLADAGDIYSLTVDQLVPSSG
jgi:hypothetical protein